MKRPLLRYFGGKFRIADWVVSHFPDHLYYVEPFGGAASVLLAKGRSRSEVYNDMNTGVVSLFQVLRDPEQSKKLIGLIALTPYAREEFDLSYDKAADPIENARRLIVRSHMAFSTSGIGKRSKTGFRNDHKMNPADEWHAFPASLNEIAERLRGVIIENRPAAELIAKMDDVETLFYLDPPYLPSTRVNGGYDYEMSEEDHIELLELISGLKGKVVISGYDSDLYNSSLLPLGYQKRTRSARGQRGGGGAKITEEVLWISPNALDHGLFCMGEAV